MLPDVKIPRGHAAGRVQVLGNAELRERYDAGGQKALDINFMEVRRSTVVGGWGSAGGGA